MKSKWILSTIIALFANIVIQAQNKDNSINLIIDKELLIKDIEILKQNLETAQPGLYNYTSKEEMDVFFKGITNKISQDMSSIDFFRLVAPLSNKVRNGHTILVPSSNWEDHVISNLSLLPFDLYFYNNQLYIMHNLSDNKDIPEGSVFKSINGKSAIEVFDFIVNRWFKDGYNKTRPREIAEEEFRFLYAHFFGAKDLYTIDITTPEGIDRSFNIQGIKESLFKKRLKQRYNTNYTPWWRRTPDPLSLKITKNKAYLKVTQFSKGLKSTENKRFKSFIKNAFKTIKANNVKNLILDLRGNQGGDVIPQLELLQHLIRKPFHLYKDVYANVRALPNPEYYQFDFLSKVEFGKNFKDKPLDGKYGMKMRPGFSAEPQNPSPYVFKGQLYVLIDGWSFSATGEVCGIIKEHRNDAVFVGEETGGNPVTNISGIQTFMTLPHSKIRILICLVNYTTDVSFNNDGHGIKPHYVIRNSVFDVLEEKDAVLNKVNRLIAESKK